MAESVLTAALYDYLPPLRLQHPRRLGWELHHHDEATRHPTTSGIDYPRGTASPRVGDIDVLGRIADGLAMPDEARVLLGLAPAQALTSLDPFGVIGAG
jgi:hypothetical protein